MEVFLSADVFVFETLLMQLNPLKLYYEFSFFFFFLFKIDLFILLSAPFFFTLLFLIIFALVMLRFSLIVTIYAMHISLPFHVT
jgi:hypothetical protein